MLTQKINLLLWGKECEKEKGHLILKTQFSHFCCFIGQCLPVLWLSLFFFLRHNIEIPSHHCFLHLILPHSIFFLLRKFCKGLWEADSLNWLVWNALISFSLTNNSFIWHRNLFWQFFFFSTLKVLCFAFWFQQLLLIYLLTKLHFQVAFQIFIFIWVFCGNHLFSKLQ